MYTVKSYWENDKTIATLNSEAEAISMCKNEDGYYVLNADNVMIFNNIVLPF